MYEANIKKQHWDIFEERVLQIKPLLDRARNIIWSNNKTSMKNIYISGGCAAWLTGRTDTFDDITIYLLNRSLAARTYGKMFKEYMKCKDNLIIHKSVYSTPLTIGPINSRMKHVMMEFTYKGTPSLKFRHTHLDIHDVEKWLSDFSALSVFINLYDLNEIRTAECRCCYESNCIVTQDGCVRHSRVVYPLMFDSTNSNTLPVDNKLKNQDIIMYIDDLEKNLKEVHERCLKSFFVYPTRLFIDPDLYPNRIMSFCEYSCSKCIDRDKLTKKYVDIWRHKTYAPGGYGSKIAAQRFKGIDTDFCKQYCTCKSLTPVAKRQRCNPPNSLLQ